MFLARLPLILLCIATTQNSFDLHVLSVTLAFILSQGQTLHKKVSFCTLFLSCIGNDLLRKLLPTEMVALIYFPSFNKTSIIDETMLNFCIRNGNRWTLTVKNTNYGTPSGTRTLDTLIKSQVLYQLS